MRIWFGRARTAKDLFDLTGTALVSRLDYYDLSVFTGEAFTRFDTNNGWFIKANVGGGGLFHGQLKDEDFPPFIVPLIRRRSAAGRTARCSMAASMPA